MKLPSSQQQGAALIVALVALIILTVLGVATMSDVMNQSVVVRNEQFRQQVFYAANSEVNAQIRGINNNSQESDDQIIEDLLDTSTDGSGLNLSIVVGGASPDSAPILTVPEAVTLTTVQITGEKHAGNDWACPGESASRGNLLHGNIDSTAVLDDGRGSIQSVQRQRYQYCWP